VSSNAYIEVTFFNIIITQLYGCEPWSLSLREKHELRVIENRVQRRVFSLKRKEVKGEWRKLRKEELNDMYCSSNINLKGKSRIRRWAGHLASMGVKKGVYRVLVRKIRRKDTA